MEATKHTNILVCSTGSTPHSFNDHLKRSRIGMLEYYNFIIDLDGAWIEGKSWEPGDTVRVAYVGGLTSNAKPKDTRTEEQAFSLIQNLALFVIDHKLNPNRISVYEERKKVSALEQIRGKKIELAGLAGFTYDEFKEELEDYLGFFGLLEDSDFEDPDPTGLICLN